MFSDKINQADEVNIALKPVERKETAFPPYVVPALGGDLDNVQRCELCKCIINKPLYNHWKEECKHFDEIELS